MAASQSIRALILLAALTLPACALSREAPPSADHASGDTAAAPAALASAAPPADKQVGLPKSSRKVIRNAELSIEVTSPAAAEAQVSRLIESMGGYVSTSDRQAMAEEGASGRARVQLSLRVPAERLEQALREIKSLGRGAESEKIGSEDVTDEYIDVEARITNQRRLETQLASLLTQANKVDEALKVHQELTSVRTEIDRLEGRKRFLDTESSLATISLSLSPLRPVVAASSNEFAVSVRHAASDAVALAAGILNFLIRATGVLLPLSVLFGLPTLALVLLLRRRQRRAAAAVSSV
jgi:Domain of unknown function (DUF4349)